ncbi:MAG: peroxisomal membrane protein pex14 [Caeruleum heppii]|nr:MAG: peroxisomal membrane protein pex14 [Caeruleum heppii]
MIREELVASAVTFLQDPSVAASPVEKRIAFLESKDLTQEEVEAALARAGDDPSSVGRVSSTSGFRNDGYTNQQVMRQQQPYGGYGPPPGYWQQPPPEVPRRDWRDWFIMATVMGGVSYGLFFVAKRYIYPLIAPPTPPQLEQDKQAIDESFDKAFTLLEQLGTDTESLKASEQARTERLDAALQEVESVISELKTASRRREDESRKINDDVRGLKDLIPKAMEAQRDATDQRLKELNEELKSLKTLVSNRMSAPARNAPGVSTSSGINVNGSGTRTPTAGSNPGSASSGGPVGGSVNGGQLDSERPVGSSSTGRKESSNAPAPSNRAAIPAWQMAAANKTPSATASSAVSTPSGE